MDDDDVISGQATLCNPIIKQGCDNGRAGFHVDLVPHLQNKSVVRGRQRGFRADTECQSRVPMAPMLLQPTHGGSVGVCLSIEIFNQEAAPSVTSRARQRNLPPLIFGLCRYTHGMREVERTTSGFDPFRRCSSMIVCWGRSVNVRRESSPPAEMVSDETLCIIDHRFTMSLLD
ncbi:hypothetical protein TEQG_00582 [Trichophyton equinum CBS 127.97]|uniref:Uncharacterized protein n=1 Tax=Trichophyton equinum (strain ATCC MYA-4606 / CBS 127.97) TaxID=559882 RepID=F2PHX3_TRIEC|nr:hypothetical protein TEQG_00582 [Trichophyton equinum CBS 127.97]